MTQLQRPFPGGTLTQPEPTATSASDRVPRLALAGIGLAMIMAASVIVAISFNQHPAAQVPRPLARGPVVDGWMPAISAANRHARAAEAAVTRDGWSSYLLAPEQPVIDGWSVRYLSEGE